MPNLPYSHLQITTRVQHQQTQPILTPIDDAACDTLVYPENTGDATVEILNLDISETMEVEAGSELALAVQVTRGENRAQKIKLYQSDCENALVI